MKKYFITTKTSWKVCYILNHGVWDNPVHVFPGYATYIWSSNNLFFKLFEENRQILQDMGVSEIRPIQRVICTDDCNNNRRL